MIDADRVKDPHSAANAAVPAGFTGSDEADHAAAEALFGGGQEHALRRDTGVELVVAGDACVAEDDDVGVARLRPGAVSTVYLAIAFLSGKVRIKNPVVCRQ
jgi:hypothetical protein